MDFISATRLRTGGWKAFESGVARLLQHVVLDSNSLSRFQDVRVVGGRNDYGADVIAHFEGERWVFQCKHWRSSVDVLGVRDVLDAMRMYKAKRGRLVCLSGLDREALEEVQRQQSYGHDIEVWDLERLIDLFHSGDSWPANRRHTPDRPYQESRIEELENLYLSGEKSALVVLATGLGKTTLAAEFIARLLSDGQATRVLVLAHRNPLINQLERDFWSQLRKTWSTDVWTGEVKSFTSADIVFANFDSLSTLSRRTPLEFDVVIVDEAHHLGENKYNHILESVRFKFLLGLTATPWRGDGYSVLARFRRVLEPMGIIEGMQAGYLANVDYHVFCDNVDWDKIAALSKGAVTRRTVNRTAIVPQRDEAMAEEIVAWWKLTGKSRFIVFCQTIDHAERMAALLEHLGVLAEALVLKPGSTARDRNILINRFRDGELDSLVAVEILNEGIDIPTIGLLAFCRQTHSRRIFVQQLGRGLRVSADKSSVVVLDFVTDIARIQEQIAFEREHRERRRTSLIVQELPDHIVQFNSPYAAKLVDEWMFDVATIDDPNSRIAYNFPDPNQPLL